MAWELKRTISFFGREDHLDKLCVIEFASFYFLFLQGFQACYSHVGEYSKEVYVVWCVRLKGGLEFSVQGKADGGGEGLRV